MLGNNTSHENQAILQTQASDEPFDIIFLDVWSPGDGVLSKDGKHKSVTMTDCLTGFTDFAFTNESNGFNAEDMAELVLQNFFVRRGMPRMVVVDADGLFAGVFRAMCQALLIPCEAVSRENHKANTCERFHRLLNKVQRINTSDTGTQFRWKQAVAFASYAWNAAPIDGTDLPRCVVAVGRDFPFPIDVNTATARTLGPSASQQALEFFDARFPLLQKQRELLNLFSTS